jgi:replicative DNA helicase
MTGSQLADRALSNLGRVSSVSIRAPKRLDDAEWMRVNSAGAKLNDLPLLIDESSSLTVDALCARVRQCDASKRLGLVVIDYLTQITPPRAESITEGIQTITRQLKALAKEIQVPIMLLSQLNRDGENRPTLSSLRSSGAIEQDADVVALLHRPNSSEREKIEFILAKQRNGPCGELYFHADMDAMRFLPGEKPSTPELASAGFRKYGRGAAA